MLLRVSILMAVGLAACVNQGNLGGSDASDSRDAAPVDTGEPDASAPTDAGTHDGIGADTLGSDVAIGDTGNADASVRTMPDGAPVVACGTNYCRSGETCVAGACVRGSCVGVNVPGDYPTIQAAISALQSVGGTICVAAMTFSEPLTIQATQPLRLFGVSADRTIINGVLAATTIASVANIDIADLTVVSPTSSSTLTATNGATVTVSNARFTSHTTSSINSALAIGFGGGAVGGSVALSGVTVASDAGSALIIYRSDSNGGSVTIDSCDIGAATSAAAGIDLQMNNPMGLMIQVTVSNTYVHDATSGIRFDEGVGLSPLNWTIALFNNTLVNNTTGIDVRPTQRGVSLSDFNSVIAGSTTAIATDTLGGVMVSTSGNNCLSNDTANYLGAAPSAGDVRADALLDSLTPPGLGVGSPCRGAGDPAHASDHDYWGRARGAAIDIGAIQSSP